MNNNNYKWETVGKSKFYTDGTTCTDIEVMDNAKTVSFIYPKIRINREKCQKVFSSVENLIIGRDVFSIIIPNKLFPNVKKVESKSSSYTTGKYLVEKAGMILRNAFGQSEDAAVDFTQFNRIGNYAFEGCKAKSAAGLDEMRIAMVQEAAFVNSGFLDQPFVGGIKCLGPFIIDIDETADEIVLPKSDVSFCVKKRPKKAVRVPNLNAVAALRVLPKKVIIEDEKINYDDALLYKLYSQDIEEIESHISRYKTVDGIVYSADMKTLILCPQGKTGEVIIPDGVVRIRKSAFSNSKIKKVIFPDTMQTIGDEAFYACEKLKEIDFGHGITRIGENGNQNMFSGCAFKKIAFPPQIKEIGMRAFSLCYELEEVIFNEGLEVIQKEAFRDCPNLLEVNLPASIKKVGKEAFVCKAFPDKIQDMNINMTTIPESLGSAITCPANMHKARCVNVHIDNRNGIFDFVLPCSISAVGSAYSNIVNAFNQMADGCGYDSVNLRSPSPDVDEVSGSPYTSSNLRTDGQSEIGRNLPSIDDARLWNLRYLKTAYMDASNPIYKYVSVYKTYKKTKNKDSKEFLIDNQKHVAKAIALEMEEKDFVDFVKLDFINLQYDADIV